MTQCLLTLGAIPAISVDTPRYPEERQGRGCALGGDAGQSGAYSYNLQLRVCSDEMQKQAAMTKREG